MGELRVLGVVKMIKFCLILILSSLATIGSARLRINSFLFRQGVTICQFTVNALVMELQQDESLDMQISGFVSSVCETLQEEADVSHCTKTVTNYWAYAAPEIYNQFLLQKLTRSARAITWLTSARSV